MSHHTCHALHCDENVPPRMHMCAKHWRMVPRHKQSALWASYRRGQERDKQPSIAYLEAAAACVRSVAEQEGQDPADIEEEVGLYLTWAEMLKAHDT